MSQVPTSCVCVFVAMIGKWTEPDPVSIGYKCNVVLLFLSSLGAYVDKNNIDWCRVDDSQWRIPVWLCEYWYCLVLADLCWKWVSSYYKHMNKSSKDCGQRLVDRFDRLLLIGWCWHPRWCEISVIIMSPRTLDDHHSQLLSKCLAFPHVFFYKRL